MRNLNRLEMGLLGTSVFCWTLGIIVLTVVLTSSGCATATVRTRSSDPVMRVAIDADTISPQSYARLVYALVEAGKFVVVDRSAGLKAVAHEQEMQHTTTRFGANEKYALWGRLMGVGGIFVATEQCEGRNAFITNLPYDSCLLNLTLLDATTGEVIAVSEVKSESRGMLAPEWSDSVDQLLDHYPKQFVTKHDLHQTIEYDSSLKEYREVTVPANTKSEKQMKPEDHLFGVQSAHDQKEIAAPVQAQVVAPSQSK